MKWITFLMRTLMHTLVWCAALGSGITTAWHFAHLVVKPTATIAVLRIQGPLHFAKSPMRCHTLTMITLKASSRSELCQRRLIGLSPESPLYLQLIYSACASLDFCLKYSYQWMSKTNHRQIQPSTTNKTVYWILWLYLSTSSLRSVQTSSNYE